MLSRNRWLWLPLLAASAFLLICVLPKTRWIVLSQARMLITPPLGSIHLLRDIGIREGVPAGNPDAEREVLARVDAHPDDYTGQLAAAFATSNWQERVHRLRLLVPRFPQKPSLRAHVLRFSAYSVRSDNTREAEFITVMTGVPPAAVTFRTVGSSPGAGQAGVHPADEAKQAAWAAHDADCAAGEALDPDNAYFPFMRAVWLFAAYRDKEALAAMQRASMKTRYDDYISEESEVTQARMEAAFGPAKTLDRTLITAVVLYPHYAILRGAGRLSAMKAVQAELAGKPQEGLAIRRAQMRIGSLMRTQARSVIGVLVGIAIAQIANQRPGGAEPLAINRSSAAQENTARRQILYSDYLARTGHRDEQAWFDRESAAQKQAQAIIKNGMKVSPMAPGQLAVLSGQWMLGIALLANIGGIGALCLCALALQRLKQTNGLLTVALLSGVCLLCLLFALKAEWAQTFGVARSAMFNLMADAPAPSAPGADDMLKNPVVMRLSGALLSIVGPALTLLVLGIGGVVRKEGGGTALARGLSRTGVALTSALLLLYVGSVVVTANSEARTQNALMQMRRGEGSYLARQLGQQWPM